MLPLSPYSFVTEARLMAYLGRESANVSAGERERIVESANAALGWMEHWTARRLACRTYRTAVTISCNTTVDDATVAGTTFTTNVKALDDVVGTGLAAGSRVASITSATELELDRNALASGTGVSLTFGSARLRLDGSGTNRIYLPEYPVVEVYNLAYEVSGSEASLSTTNALLVKETGLYILAQEAFPEGEGNILVGFKAGYQKPTGSALGDYADWSNLARVQLRVAQIFFQDEVDAAGRIVNRSLVNTAISLPDFQMPRDVTDALEPYRRRWA